MNTGLFLKICIEATKGYMFPQNIFGTAINLFIHTVPNAERFRQEIDGKLKHLQKSNETSIALSLNILEFLNDFIRGKSEYRQICVNLLPKIENKKEFHSTIIDLIHKYPESTYDILDIIKGSIIVSYIFQRIAQPEPEKESQVRLTIIDGMPGLTYLINGIEGAQFSFKIEAEKIFERIIKIHLIYAENKEFLSDLASLHLLCTDSLESQQLPPVHLHMTLKDEFDGIGLSEETLSPVIFNLINSNDPLCCDMAFHLLRLMKLWNSKRLKAIAIQLLKSSAPLYQGQNRRRKRAAKEANILSDIQEEELSGIILPRSSKQKQHFKQNEASSKALEKEILQLKTEINKNFFENLLAFRNEIKTEEDSIHWEKITRLLISKLSNVQKPIHATFNPKVRQQFEKSIYKLLEFILKQNELRSAVLLFKWSLEQEIFLYDLTGWAFITDHLLYPCIKNSLADLLEPILIQFSHNIDKKAFQHFLDFASDRKEDLKKNFPRLFFIPKSAVEPDTQPNINITIEPHEKDQVVNNQTGKIKTTHNRKNKKEKLESFHQAMEKMKDLNCKIRSKNKSISKESSLEILSIAFNIKSFDDLVENQIELIYYSYFLDDIYREIFIKNVYEAASRHIKDSSIQELIIKNLFKLWKMTYSSKIENHRVQKHFQKLKEEEDRSRSYLARLSKMTNLLLKHVPLISGLFLGASLLYSSTILMKRFFFYEEEPSLTAELIKDIAINTIQSLAEYCVTFNHPSIVDELKVCYENEHERLMLERVFMTRYPFPLFHGGKTYIIKPSLPNDQHSYGLIEFIP